MKNKDEENQKENPGWFALAVQKSFSPSSFFLKIEIM